MQTATRFRIEDLVRLPTFLLPRVSPDERHIAYYSDQTGSMEVWVVDASGQTRQVSHGGVPRSPRGSLVWNRAGTVLAFPRDRDGNEQHDICLLEVATGEITQVTDAPHAQEIPLQFSPDDKCISFLSTRNGQMNLFTVRPDGSDVRQLTDFSSPVSPGAHWSPDGRWLAVNATEHADRRTLDIYLVDTDGGGARLLYGRGAGTREMVSDWSPDGRFLAITSDAGGLNRPGLLEVEGGRLHALGGEDLDESAVAFSPDGGTLLVVRNSGARLLPVLYDLATGAERVPSLPAAGSLSDQPAFLQDGRALSVPYSTDATRPALLRYDLQGEESTDLIAPTSGPIDPAAFAVAEDVTYPSFDGLLIHALLYCPHEVEAGERIPAVVMPHGGPTAQYFHGFDTRVQVLVNEGYAVLLPNIRGSTGYGVAFRDMAIKDWGGADLQDIVAGREYLTSLPFIDAERIAVMGGSYGGYMTFMATTKAPQYWRAGLALVGITDLHALYAESMPHFKHYLEQQMGDPEADAALWRERSAATFAHQLQARLRIVHGLNDPRCPISQARIFRDQLIAAGKVEGQDFEYEELSAQGHGSFDQEQRLHSLTSMVDFLARAL